MYKFPIEKQFLTQNTAEKIRDRFQDYFNEFNAIKMTLMGSKIAGVRKIIKDGYRVMTVEEYLEKYREEGRNTLNAKERKNPLFIKKAKVLSELANQINSLGENIDEPAIRKTMAKVKEIIYS